MVKETERVTDLKVRNDKTKIKQSLNNTIHICFVKSTKKEKNTMPGLTNNK